MEISGWFASYVVSVSASLAVNETPPSRGGSVAALETKLMERLQLNSERNDDTSVRHGWAGNERGAVAVYQLGLHNKQSIIFSLHYISGACF